MEVKNFSLTFSIVTLVPSMDRERNNVKAVFEFSSCQLRPIYTVGFEPNVRVCQTSFPPSASADAKIAVLEEVRRPIRCFNRMHSTSYT